MKAPIARHASPTIPHQPRTWQIGDGAPLASRTGSDVGGDFRSADVAAGGFCPALSGGAGRHKPLVVLNLGAVGNVIWIGSRAIDILAFDTGPTQCADRRLRALAHTGQPVDRWPAPGRPMPPISPAFLPPFSTVPAQPRRFRGFPAAGFSPEDGAATLTATTAAAFCRASERFPAPVRRWLGTGGGRHNRALGSARHGGGELGWNGDALEPQAFAYPAVRSRRDLPLSLPAGVPPPMAGGRFFAALARSATV